MDSATEEKTLHCIRPDLIALCQDASAGEAAVPVLLDEALPTRRYPAALSSSERIAELMAAPDAPTGGAIEATHGTVPGTRSALGTQSATAATGRGRIWAACTLACALLLLTAELFLNVRPARSPVPTQFQMAGRTSAAITVVPGPQSVLLTPLIKPPESPERAEPVKPSSWAEPVESTKSLESPKSEAAAHACRPGRGSEAGPGKQPLIDPGG